MNMQADPASQYDPQVAAMLRASREAGLDPQGARLLHHYSNAIFHLPAANAVARVTSGLRARSRIQFIWNLTRWLAEERAFAATRPLSGTSPVIITDELVVSFWDYYAQPHPPRTLTSRDLARLLRELHGLEPPPMAVPAWEPLVSLHDTLHDTSLPTPLTGPEQHWLSDQITAVREVLRVVEWPLGVGLIHGDAWVGNLLHATGTPFAAVLGDWDWAAVGPREVDLVPTWHAARRYGKGTEWIHDFRAVYGYDLSEWDGLPALMAMRDLVQLTGPMRRASSSPRHAIALRQRLDALRTGDTTSRWTAL